MRRTIDELLDEARAGLDRPGPEAAYAAQEDGALLVDIRGDDQIRQGGEIPGAIRIARNVLEWRFDPTCEAADPRLTDVDTHVILVCQQGYQSSLAAATLHRIGFTRVTDLDGGFEAWVAAGLPVLPAATPGLAQADAALSSSTGT